MIVENILRLKEEIPKEVKLIAISKTKPTSDIIKAYNSGHIYFGENKIQEMEIKFEKFPKISNGIWLDMFKAIKLNIWLLMLI